MSRIVVVRQPTNNDLFDPFRASDLIVPTTISIIDSVNYFGVVRRPGYNDFPVKFRRARISGILQKPEIGVRRFFLVNRRRPGARLH